MFLMLIPLELPQVNIIMITFITILPHHITLAHWTNCETDTTNSQDSRTFDKYEWQLLQYKHSTKNIVNLPIVSPNKESHFC